MNKLLLFGMLITSTVAHAQNKYAFRDLPISIGYYGDNLVHPGMKLGTNVLLASREKTKVHKWKGLERKRGSKIKQIEYTGDFNLGFYNHPNSHTGVFLGVGATRLRTNTRKYRSVGWSAELNYLRRFYNIETFELEENGEIRKVTLAGNNALMFNMSPSFGKIIEATAWNRSIRIYGKPGLQLVKYNHAWSTNAAFELGLTLNAIGR